MERAAPALRPVTRSTRAHGLVDGQADDAFGLVEPGGGGQGFGLGGAEFGQCLGADRGVVFAEGLGAGS